uniref:RNA-directed DNA polymerase n=1 Tax=Plectus sambesii TaxID=2011161 RepID=A0A914UXR7_9BILA
MELDGESKKLVVINTHRGLFQYNRLPFGVSSAPAIFQQVMDKMLAGIQGVGAYLDDVIISGSSEAEHDRRLHQVLQRIADYGFHVRQEKCSWRVTSVEYLGFIFDADGLHTNPKKTAAIMTMPPPKNLSMLRSFLGMVNHYGKFLPSLADRLAPLHKLLKKDASDKHVKFEWSAECQKAFERIKADLASPLMLTHYKPELPIIVAADASNEGIGAVIAH